MNLGFGYDLFSGFLQSDCYYWISVIAYAVLLAAPFVFWKSSRRGTVFISCMAAAFITVMLLPLYAKQMNVDEGTHLLMAYSLINGGMPFRDFEGNSAGPLNAIYLALFSFGSISFLTARLAVLFSGLAGGIMVFLAVRKLCGIRPAMALSSLMFFYYSVHYYDVMAYNSETPFCLVITLWLMLFAFRGSSRRIIFAEFFAIGLMPWIKLQFVPFAAICFVISLSRGVFVRDSREAVAISHGEPGYSRSGEGFAGTGRSFRELLSVNISLQCFAAALPTLLFVLLFALTGALERFWLYYVIGNLHAVAKPFIDYLECLFPFLRHFSDLDMFSLATCVFLAFMVLAVADIKIPGPGIPGSNVPGSSVRRFLAAARLSLSARRAAGIILLALFVLVALFSASRTETLFDHYLNILVLSSAIFAALGLARTEGVEKRGQWAFALLVVAAVVFGTKLWSVNKISELQQTGFVTETNYKFRDALHYLNNHTKPGEPVAYWGWETGLPIYSGHPSATSTHLISEIMVLDKRIRTEYAHEVTAYKPSAIVDLVCPDAFDYKDSSYELSNYDFMKKITDEYYEKPVAIPVGSKGYVRIYLRKKDN